MLFLYQGMITESAGFSLWGQKVAGPFVSRVCSLGGLLSTMMTAIVTTWEEGVLPCFSSRFHLNSESFLQQISFYWVTSNNSFFLETNIATGNWDWDKYATAFKLIFVPTAIQLTAILTPIPDLGVIFLFLLGWSVFCRDLCWVS